MTILNKDKKIFNPNYDTPTYVFDGTYEEYLELRAKQKVFLSVNVFLIDYKCIVK